MAAVVPLEPFREVPNDPSTHTAVIDRRIKATISDGLLPSKIQTLGASGSPIVISSVKSALEMTFYSPSRHVLFLFDVREQAETALSAIQHTWQHVYGVGCALKMKEAGKYCELQICSVPVDINNRQILSLVAPHTAEASKVIFCPLSYQCPNPIEILRRKITEITGRRTTETPEMLTLSNQAKRGVRFEVDGAQNLLRDAQTLDQMNYSEFNNTQIFVVERLHAKFTVTRRTYKSVESKLQSLLKHNMRELHVRTKTDPNQSADFVLRMDSTIRPNLIEAMSSVYDLIAADVQSGIDHKQQLRAKQPVQSHRIRLARTTMFQRVKKGGLVRAQRMYGDEVVQFEPDSDPPAVMVYGDTAVLRKVQEAMFTTATKTDLVTECSICYEDVGEGVSVAGCGHTCCTRCFQAYCTLVTDDKFPLRCFESQCEQLLPVQLLRRILGTSDFTAILQRAVKAYQKKHPAEYAACLEPDCDAYYESVKDIDSRHHLCPSCLAVICTQCQTAAHYGESCEAYQDRISGHQRAMEGWMQRENAKPCPNCRSIIQKSDGCDHMHCVSCEVHFCWACMTSASTKEPIYQHMREVHGDYGDEHANAAIEEINQVHEALARAQFG